MKYSTISVVLSALCSSLAAAQDDKPFNASSGWQSFQGYDVSSSDKEESDWQIEMQVYAEPGGKGRVSEALFLKDNQKHMADAKEGWSLCNALYTTKARRDSKPVDKTCKGILSEDCIKALKTREQYPDNDYHCFLNFGGNGTDSSACDIESHVVVPLDWQTMRKHKDGVWNQTFVSWLKQNDTSRYDSAVADVLVVYSSWWAPGDKASSEGSVTCLGMEDFSEGSRSLDDAIKASKDHLEEPKSASTSLQVGWTVLMASLIFVISTIS